MVYCMLQDSEEMETGEVGPQYKPVSACVELVVLYPNSFKNCEHFVFGTIA